MRTQHVVTMKLLEIMAKHIRETGGPFTRTVLVSRKNRNPGILVSFDNDVCTEGQKGFLADVWLELDRGRIACKMRLCGEIEIADVDMGNPDKYDFHKFNELVVRCIQFEKELLNGAATLRKSLASK